MLHIYDDDTAINLMDYQGHMFYLIPMELPDADVFSFIDGWMCSASRMALDNGSPKLIYKSGYELLMWYLNQELFNKYPKRIYENDPHILHWVGLIYQLYCYEEKIASAELVRILPPDVLYSMYHPWHELSDMGAIRRIKDYVYKREGKIVSLQHQ